MRWTEYFKNPTLRFAIGLAALWHLFWLFVIAIDVTGSPPPGGKSFSIHFVGPVLSDDSFNMIVATRPEISQSFYRSQEEAFEELEPQTAVMNRREPGDLVSVPMGKSGKVLYADALEEKKPYADTEFHHKFSVDIIKSPFPVEGDLKTRDILYVPEIPRADNLDSRKSPKESEFRLIVNPQGDVVDVQNLISSGDPSLDLEWQRYLKKWQFMPNSSPAAKDQQGTVRIRTGSDGTTPVVKATSSQRDIQKALEERIR